MVPLTKIEAKQSQLRNQVKLMVDLPKMRFQAKTKFKMKVIRNKNIRGTYLSS